MSNSKASIFFKIKMLHPDYIRGKPFAIFSRQFKTKIEIISWRDSISEIASRLNRGQIAACFRFDRRVSHCKLRLLIGGINGIFCKLHCFCKIEQVQTIMFRCCLSLSFCIWVTISILSSVLSLLCTLYHIEITLYCIAVWIKLELI